MDSLAAEYGDLLIRDVEETGVELGRGSYGTVFEVKWRGELRAAKKLHDFFFEPAIKDWPGPQKGMKNFKREFRSWAKLDHPNMVRLLGLYYNPSRSVRVPIIVMEKMDISLGDYLEKNTRQAFPLHKKVWVLLQVARALSYLHSQSPPLVHNDLKPDNIMITTTTFEAKLSDFGMIRAITRGNLTRASSKKGTPVFMPPEALEIPLRYDEKLDVFSYGVVIISTLVHDKAPLPSAAVVNQGGRPVAVSEFGQRKFHTDKFTPEEQRLFLTMIQQCLEFIPARRPLSSQLVDGMSTILASLPSKVTPADVTDGDPPKAKIAHHQQGGFVQPSSEKKVLQGSVDEMKTLKEKVAALERRCQQAETERGAMEESHAKLQRAYEELCVAKLQEREANDRESLSKQQLQEEVAHYMKRFWQAEAERAAMEESHIKPRWRPSSRSEWQLAYEKSLSEYSSVSVKVNQCIFGGSPAVGKSSLKHFLVHNTPKAVKTSTAVLDTPEVVTISSQHYAVENDTSAWQLVSDDLMATSLRACINARSYDNNEQYPSEVDKSEKVQEESSPMAANQSEHLQRGQGDTLPFPMQTTTLDQRQQSEGTQAQSYQEKGSSPIALLEEHHSQLCWKMGGDGEIIKLKNASFIYLLDTGGQPSFQVVLPLLLNTPCTYIHVFNAARDLDQPVPIMYRPDDHTEQSLSPSAETGWEMMLRSFSSMYTMAHKCSKELDTFQQERAPLPQHSIFVVGTFKDQLVKEGRHGKAFRDIGTRLRELEGKPYYNSITWDRIGQPFYLLNCMAEKSDDKVCINRLRQCLSAGGAGSSLQLNVPVMWYMCQLTTQRVPQKFFRFNDLKEFCLKCKFIDSGNANGQFRSLLKLFSLLGFYSFFDLKDVSDEANYVCTDRGVFLKEVSKLLAVQFVVSKSPLMERFKKTGILVFAHEFFKELDMNPEMDLRWFLKVLCQLGIAACLPTKEQLEYFIPAVLPHIAMLQDPLASVAPLCLSCKIGKGAVFSYNDLPQGVFCHLAVELIRHEWKIIANESTRTLLKFCWQEFDVFLQESPGYIAVIPQAVEEFSDLSELHTSCETLRHIVTKCFLLSSEAVLGSHWSTKAELVVGFECPCKEVSMRHLAQPSCKGKSLICMQKSSRQLYSKRQRIWYSTVDGATLHFCPSDNVWTLVDSASSGKVSATHNATLVQVIQVHAEEFLKAMNSKEIAPKLKAMEVIPESVANSILLSKDKEEANTHLLTHLKENANETAIKETFRVASEKTGCGKMNTFAAFMLRELQ